MIPKGISVAGGGGREECDGESKRDVSSLGRFELYVGVAIVVVIVVVCARMATLGSTRSVYVGLCFHLA